LIRAVFLQRVSGMPTHPEANENRADPRGSSLNDFFRGAEMAARSRFPAAC